MQRRNPPDAGLWGYPGGKIEPGEMIMQAACRELHEETGISASPRALLTPFDVLRHDAQGRLSAHFILLPVSCTWRSGTAAASSDALRVGWFTLCELSRQSALQSERVLELATELNRR